MNVIRDEEMKGLMMIPLFHQYGVHYCHVKNCPCKATTLLMDVPEAGIVGICEAHYLEAKAAGKWKLSLDMTKDQSFKPVE